MSAAPKVPQGPEVTVQKWPVPLTKDHKLVMFSYVPGSGLWSHAEGVWTKAPKTTPVHAYLRQYSKLAIWLTNHPLSVVYGETGDDGLGLLGITSGGQWLTTVEAQGQLLTIPWSKTISTAGLNPSK